MSTLNKTPKYIELLGLYPDIEKTNFINRIIKHNVKHHNLTTGQTVLSRARQLVSKSLAKQEF